MRIGLIGLRRQQPEIALLLYLLVFIRNLLVHLAEKILLLQPLKFGGITPPLSKTSDNVRSVAISNSREDTQTQVSPGFA